MIRPLIIAAILALCAGLAHAQAPATRPSSLRAVGPVPDQLRVALSLSPFYRQHVDCGGLPVIASEKPSPYALLEAAYLIDQMLEGRDDIRAAMARNKVRFTVMAASELTTDVPEHATLEPKRYWDRRARGLGATRGRPCVSCGEENLLNLKGDPYPTENVLVHEFAHAVHNLGASAVDRTFDRRLRAAYADAMAKGLWKGTYAATDVNEYFAEGVQSWFDTNRPPDRVHNDVDTREEIKAYDPVLAKLIEEVFGDRPWRYTRPDRRKELAHLAGFDRAKAPSFTWPAEIKDTLQDRPPPRTRPSRSQ